MKKIYIETLGCPKNWVDSEKLIGEIPYAFELVQEAEAAEILIVNTCTFIEASRIESIESTSGVGNGNVVLNRSPNREWQEWHPWAPLPRWNHPRKARDRRSDRE